MCDKAVCYFQFYLCFHLTFTLNLVYHNFLPTKNNHRLFFRQFGNIKGTTGRRISKQFPELNIKGSVWTRAYFVATTGNLSSEPFNIILKIKVIDMQITYVLELLNPNKRKQDVFYKNIKEVVKNQNIRVV